MAKNGVLAVIPARGGSKGIPLKNLRTVAGKTLLARTIEVAQAIPEISDVCVSTDHADIKAAAEAYDHVLIVDRPDELSGDRVPDSPVLQHATLEAETSNNTTYDIVVMLQVTSPLRTVDDVRLSIERLIDTGCDAVWTVSPTELHYHPLKQLIVDEDSSMRLFDDAGLQIVARQQLTPVYHRNGCSYAMKRDFLMRSDGLYSPGSSQAIISEGERVNIDTEEDLERAHELLRLRESVQ